MMNLSINKDMLTPVIEEQVKAMMTTILGGKDRIVDNVISQVLKTKVDCDGRPSTYSSAKPYIEYLLNAELTKAIKEVITEEIQSRIGVIRRAVKKQIQSDKGASIIADALLGGLNKTLEGAWSSEFNIVINQRH